MMRPIKLNEIGNKLPQIDLFIGAVSFEERFFSFIDNIDSSQFSTIWFTYNENEKEFYSENLSKAKNISSELIEFSTDDSLVTGKNLLEKFSNLESNINILIDISTFTHEGLLILIKFISLFKLKFRNIYSVYVGAKSYSVNEQDDNKWLSKGTKTIRSVLGYPGVMNPSQKNHLLILFGFEIERTERVIEEFEFEKVSIGVGPEKDSISSTHYDLNRKRHIDLLNKYNIAETFEISLTDPFQAATVITEQISKYPNFNIVITPLSNKMSTLAVALVALKNPKIQIAYVRPHEYNFQGYSEAADECFFLQIPLKTISYPKEF
ncbi:hypothetical protein OWR28_04930 [Chryseobacterium sp. 1B4]